MLQSSSDESRVKHLEYRTFRLCLFSCTPVRYDLILHLDCLQKKGDGAKLSALRRPLQKAAASAPSCDSLFSSPDSTLSPCFRVVSTKAASSSRLAPAATSCINHVAITYGFCQITCSVDCSQDR